ncbi:glucose-1-phosphate adenylyltransferase [Nodularia spumigena CCY9414]|nr:glucose-1-phosphate adenylyltransferase [Nodularia spumigena CCY9414]
MFNPVWRLNLHEIFRPLSVIVANIR